MSILKSPVKEEDASNKCSLSHWESKPRHSNWMAPVWPWSERDLKKKKSNSSIEESTLLSSDTDVAWKEQPDTMTQGRQQSKFPQEKHKRPFLLWGEGRDSCCLWHLGFQKRSTDKEVQSCSLSGGKGENRDGCKWLAPIIRANWEDHGLRPA
jgi:hypothetical protein